jgi:hypothetical protein
MTAPIEFILTTTANGFGTTCGIDSLEHCSNLIHFKTYTKTIIYAYNSLGYRDEEWPNDLTNHVWCVGDSFTVGLGQPYDETWPKLVEKQIGNRIINVSMNGASNDWISRRVQSIIDNFSPKAILIQWSYVHRREHTDTTLHDEDRKIHFIAPQGGRESFADPQELDKLNCIQNICKITHPEHVRIVHSFIPRFALASDAEFIYNELTKHNVNFFPEQPQIDFARDSHHYDIQTATNYANLYVNNLKI